MPCASNSSDFRIISCDGERPGNGDNNPENGAFMTWTASGADFYYTRILGNGEVYEVFRDDFGNLSDRTVFTPNQADGETYTGLIFFGSLAERDCLPEGSYTVQVWSVSDADGDLLPDTDQFGDIIGCYEECSFFYRPTCAFASEQYFTVSTRDIGCNDTGGFIELFNFREFNFYCVDNDGTGLTISWQGPNGFTGNTARVENLEPGTYVATVEDLNGCSAFWIEDIRAIDNVAFACFVRQPTSTVGGTDGAGQLDLFAGSGFYEVSWAGPVSDTIFVEDSDEVILPNLPAGSYVISVYDTLSTCSETCLLEIPPPDCSDLSLEVLERIDSDCDGSATGYIAVALGGGSNPGVTWAGPGVDGRTSTELDSLTPGVYVYTITDERGCELRGSIELIATPVLDFSCGGTDETLPFLDDGSLTLLVEGGLPPFRLDYVGTDAAGDTIARGDGLTINPLDTIRNLAAGTYALRLTDSTGCVRTCIATITEPDCDIFPNCEPRDPVSIFGNGSVTLNFDSTPDWFVTLNGARDSVFQTATATNFIDNLPQGNYTVSVYNTAGCLGGCSFAIVAPPCTLAATASATDASCNGAADGRVRLDVTGASEGLVVDWDDDAYDGRFVVNTLPAGTYRIAVSDRTECPLDTLVVTIAEPAPFSVTLSQPGAIACFGESTASLRAEVSGGAGELVYRWSVANGPNAPVLGGLPVGIYTLEVTDENGCVATAVDTIGQPPQLTLSCSATAESVASAMDGTVSVAVAGAGTSVVLSGDLGVATLPTNSDTTFTGLSPGTYELTLTDENGCTTSCTAIVNAGPCQIGLALATEQPDCDNATGAATVTPTNPFGPVTIAWSNGDTTARADSLLPGTYVVAISDATGCEATGQVTIFPFTDIPALLSSSVGEVCGDGCTELQLSLAGTPPFLVTYAFRQNGGPAQQRTISRPAGGSELICPADLGLSTLAGVDLRLTGITDGNGCFRPLDQNLPVSLFPPAEGTLDTILCAGEQLLVFGERFDSSRTTGTIVLENASANDCDSTLAVNLSFYPEPVGTFDTVLCPGEQFQLHGVTFNANRRTGEILLPGASRTGCDSSLLVSTTFLAPALGALDTLLCRGENLEYFGQVFTPNRTTGTVVLGGASQNGCDSIVDVTIGYREIAEGTLDTTICPFTFLDYYGTFFSEFRTSGRVRIPGGSFFGCDSFVDVTIDFAPLELGRIDTTVCPGEAVRIGNNVFLSTAVDVPTATGELNAFGCDSVALVTVRYFPPATVTLLGDGVICPGGQTELLLRYDGTAPATIVLSDAPNAPIILPPGETTLLRDLPVGQTVEILFVTGPAPCGYAWDGAVTVAQTDLAVAVEVLTGDELYALDCNGDRNGAVSAVVTGGAAPYTFRWSTGGERGVLAGLPAGEYSVVVTSDRGCTATGRAELNEPPPLTVVTRAVPPTCRDSVPKVILREVAGGAGSYLYRTNRSPFTEVDLPDTLLLPYGATLVEVEDENGCRLSEQFSFSPPAVPEVALSPPQAVIQYGDSVQLTVVSNLTDADYTLVEAEDSVRIAGRVFVSPEENTDYVVLALDSLGCVARATAKVLVDDFVPVYAPNVFSPNADGTNETFRLYFREGSVVAFHDFAVFNRWGGLVYREEDAVRAGEEEWGWDGNNAAGRPHDQAVYVYQVTVELADGRMVELAGDVLLLR